MSARGFAGRRAPGSLAVLALLALFVQALVPPGYMLAAAPGAGPAMVICTSHGPLKIADGSDRQAPPRNKGAGLCAFAGHGAPPIPAAAAQPLDEILWSEAASAVASDRPSVFVGRGLAAPPPARGPPTFLV